VRLHARNILVADVDGAVLKGQKTADTLKKGRLACPVRADQADYLALPDMKTHLPQGIETPKRLGDGINP